MLLYCRQRWRYLVKHPVSKAEHLSESIQPAVEEGKECQEENQDSCKCHLVLGRVQFKNEWVFFFADMDGRSHLAKWS